MLRLDTFLLCIVLQNPSSVPNGAKNPEYNKTPCRRAARGFPFIHYSQK